MTEITRSPVLVTVRSRDLANLHPYGSEGNLTLFQQVQAEPDEVLTVQVISAIIPNSWHNLSALSKNNKLRFAETGDAELVTVTIPDGSYSIDELMTKVVSLLNHNSSNGLTYSMVYDEITNTVKVHSTGAFTLNFIDQDDTCRRFLGFTQGEFSGDASTAVCGDRAVDITDTQNSLFIRSDLNNQRVIESSSTKPSNIIAVVPVPLGRNSFFVYDPMTPFEVQLGQNNISAFNLRITWQDERLVDLRKGDWELNLKINFRRLPKADRVHFKRHEDIDRRLRQFEEFERSLEMSDERKKQIRDSLLASKND